MLDSGLDLGLRQAGLAPGAAPGEEDGYEQKGDRCTAQSGSPFHLVYPPTIPESGPVGKRRGGGGGEIFAPIEEGL